MMKKLSLIKILGITVNNVSESEVLEYILRRLSEKTKKTFIVTPNPEIVMMARKDTEYKRVLASAQVSLPDGIGLLWGARVLGKQLQSRITGVDFMEELCEVASNPTRWGLKRRLTVGFVGGRGGVAEKTAECLKKSYPNLTVLYCGEDEEEFLRKFGHPRGAVTSPAGYGNDSSSVNRGGKKYIDILFVALGSPKQEKWIYKNLGKIDVRVVMGVGGAFDMVSGNVARAPKWVRKAGLEWLYRLLREPWRWRRQMALVEFIWSVMREKYKR